MSLIPFGWLQQNLEDCADINPGITKPNENIDVSFITMADISKGGRIIGGSIKPLRSIGNGFTAFTENDVLVAKITPCFENGKGALARGLKNGIGFGTTELHVLRAKKNILPEYLSLLTHMHHFREAGRINMTGSAGQKRVSREYLRHYPLMLPPIPEQIKIIQIVSLWNQAIDLTEQLVIESKKRRSNHIQQLLEGMIIFPKFSTQRINRNLGEFVDPVQRPVPKPMVPYKALGIRSHCKGTFGRFVEDPSTVEMDELFVARAGDLIVNITFAWEGAIAFVPEEHDGFLVSHRFPTYRLKEDEVDPDFFRYVVMHPRFVFQLGLISPGGAGRNRVMSKKDFLEIELSLPGLDEQRKIGQLLKLIDVEIGLLNQQLDALREQKKGLMQQLLTGKRRVKV